MQIIDSKNLPSNFYEYKDFTAISTVNEIIEDVRNNGDKAVKKYCEKFDKKIEKTNPFSEENYRDKTYSSFWKYFDYYCNGLFFTRFKENIPTWQMFGSVRLSLP